jgi:hypothetical protein
MQIAIDELQHETGLCHATVHVIIHEDLKRKKVHAYWVPQDLTPEKKKADVGAKIL